MTACNTCRICRTELESAGNVDVDRVLAKEFAGWFKKHVSHVALKSCSS